MLKISRETLRNPRVLIPAIGLAAVLLLVACGTGLAYSVFVKHSEGPVVRAVANAFPVPAAAVGGKRVLYRDYLDARDTVQTFLGSAAAQEQQLDMPVDAALEKNVLERLIVQAAMEELAAEKKIQVQDADLRAFFADVVAAASSTVPDVGVYLLENYGWDEEDFRQKILKPALLEQQLAIALASEQSGNPDALGMYLDERLSRNDVVRYLRF